MGTIPQSKIDEILHRADIVQIVEEQTQLKKAGRNYLGLCPFHQEKTPSFNVNPEKGFFKCFGCGKGGDVIRFVMDIHGYTFPEALRFLADRYGIELEYEQGAPGATRGLREKMVEINQAAMDFFRGLLRQAEEGQAARDYIAKRSIDPHFADAFGLGFAPDRWDSLLRHLKRKDLDLDLAARVGLIKQKDGGGAYDAFRNRLMFPIRDVNGRCVGFSGRDLSGDEKVGKYINSPESEIFRKHKLFHGEDLAGSAIRTKGRVILCEGNVDVVKLHQYGFAEAMASLGTAFTETHASRLSRKADLIVMIFDGDAAGKKAMRRALDLFLAIDVHPRCVVLPDGDDPDTFLMREGAEALEAHLEAAPTLIEFAVDEAFNAAGDDPEQIAKAVGEVAPILGKIADPVLQDLWIQRVAERAHVNEEALRRRIAQNRRPQQTQQGPSKAAVPGTGEASSAEAGIVRVLIHHPRMASRVMEEFDHGLEEYWVSRELADVARRLCEKALSAQNDRDYYIASVTAELDNPELQSKLAQWSLADDGIGDREAGAALADYLQRMQRDGLARRLSILENDLKSVMKAGDKARALAMMHEVQQLRRRIDQTLGPDKSVS
ncbi:MAG: DNA primase [Deltaproteobacteria bacterium]|nr:DNA primase [Deltaproteobacteria bacterium]